MVLIFFNSCSLLTFVVQLSQREINLEKLQRIASTGIPDGGGLRATAWKVNYSLHHVNMKIKQYNFF